MNEVIDRLIYSAKVLGIPQSSEIFTDAMNVGAEAMEAGYDADTAFDLARGVLRGASTAGKAEDALTAA